jgi:ferredoxin
MSRSQRAADRGGGQRQPALRPAETRRPELRVNPIACDAHGVCLELLPELIASDPWGYPVLRPVAVPLHLQDVARRAVADCPTLALRLVTPE